MKRFVRIALAALSLLACGPAFAADKPLVIESGQIKQIPAATALQLQAPTTANASLNLPHGTAPSSPNDGDCWTTSAGLYCRIFGTTVGPYISAGMATPGGSSGQLQYNNSGAFGGAAVSGDCTAVILAFTCTKLNSVSPGYFFSGTDAANLTGTLSASRIAANSLALSKLAQIGGSSYLGNQSTSTGDVTAYVWPTCTNDGAHALIYVPGASPPITCPTITAASGGSNPFAIGSANLKSGVGTPSASSDGIGSLYMRTDVSQLWGQIVPSATVPALVQSASGANTSSATFSATPASGDLLVAACTGYTSQPGANTGWTDSGLTHTPSVFEPGDRWVYKIAVTGESTSQTPCSGGGSGTGVVLFEVSGVTSWTGSLESNTFTTGQPVTYTTANANDLVLGAVFAERASADPGAASISGLSGGATTAHACCTGGGVGYAVGGAGQQFASSSSSVSVTYSFTAVTGQSARLVILKPATAGWRQFSWLSLIKNGGSSLETSPQSLDFSTGLTATTDGLGAVTITGNTGTVTHTAGSLTSGQLVVGNGSADVTVGNLSGDVSTSGGTTTAIGSNKVTNAMLRQSGALAVVGRSANSTGNVADIQATAASDAVLRESGSTIGFGTINTAGITNAAVTLAKIANASASSKLLGSGTSGSGSSYAEITVGTGLTMTGTTLSTSAGGGTVTNTGTLTAGRLIVGNGGVDVTLGLTDVTTDNCSTSAHGLAPKAPNDAAKFLDGTCNWSVPGGAGGGTVTSVAAGTGMAFSTITTSGSVTLGGVFAPQGRLTLVTATPVMTSDQTAKSTVYYDCYAGKYVPYYDGSTDQLDSISSCEVSLTMQTSGTGVTNNAGVFDVWWVHSGASRICVATNGSGGGWASDTGGSNTARGTGYSQIHNTRGYWTNVNSITNCYNGTTDYGSISADRATYLGSLYTTAAGQTGVQFGPIAASGGGNPFMALSNGYNRVPVKVTSQDNKSGAPAWTYGSTTWRASDNSNSNRASFLDGLQLSQILGIFHDDMQSGASSCALVGMALDSTSAAPASSAQSNTTNATPATVQDNWKPQLGLHFVQAMEATCNATSGSFFGSETSPTRQHHSLTIEVEGANDNEAWKAAA